MPVCALTCSPTTRLSQAAPMASRSAEEERRQRAGQDHVPQPGGLPQTAGAGRLDEPLVDVADAGVGVEVDREERAERDEA